MYMLDQTITFQESDVNIRQLKASLILRRCEQIQLQSFPEGILISLYLASCAIYGSASKGYISNELAGFYWRCGPSAESYCQSHNLRFPVAS